MRWFLGALWTPTANANLCQYLPSRCRNWSNTLDALCPTGWFRPCSIFRRQCEIVAHVPEGLPPVCRSKGKIRPSCSRSPLGSVSGPWPTRHAASMKPPDRWLRLVPTGRCSTFRWSSQGGQWWCRCWSQKTNRGGNCAARTSFRLQWYSPLRRCLFC